LAAVTASPNRVDQWGFDYKTCAFDWMKANNTQPSFFEEEVPAQVGTGLLDSIKHRAVFVGDARLLYMRINADVRQGIIAPRRQHSRSSPMAYIARIDDRSHLPLRQERERA
jgi:N6-adenosine-specific RNA methylase IME4